MKKLFNDVKKEIERIRIVEGYELFDTPSEEMYDNITFLASQVCQTPISTITLVDETRQWFKSKFGFTHDGSPIETSFCALAISKPDEVVVVPNLMEDPEFSEIGKLNGIESGGFYASVTITNEDGVALGTLCVIDYVPKVLTNDQIKGLVILGRQVRDLFNLRLKNMKLKQSNEALAKNLQELENFTSTVSHDLKTPLNQIISLVQLLKENSQINDEDSIAENETFVDYLVQSSNNLKQYIDDLLDFYKENPAIEDIKTFSVADLFDEIKNTLNPLGNYNFNFQSNVETIVGHEILLKQILVNLISNGIKYNKSEQINIRVRLESSQNDFVMTVFDNGIGIKEEDYEFIFNEFQTLSQKDRFGNFGKGLGLSRVKKLVDKINGTISIDSKLDVGTTFKIQWKQ